MIYFGALYAFFGAVFGIEALKGSIYFNSMFLGISDIIGQALVTPVLRRFKRKPVIYIGYAVIVAIAITFIWVVVPPECSVDMMNFCWQKIFQIAAISLLKIDCMIMYGIVFLYTSEVFPSEYRGIGTSFSSVLGRFGAILAPLITNIMIDHDLYPQISFGVPSLLVMFISLFGKETFGKMTERH